MAYTHDLHWNGADGSKSQENGAEYDAIYRVTTDNANHQSQKVIRYVEENIFAIGDAYEYADDVDPTSVLKSIAPTREKGSTTIWVVRLHYAPRGAGEFNFEFATEDLDFRCEDVTMQTIQHQKPVEKAIYLSGLVGKAAAKMPTGTNVLPMNSAFVPFNPGLEKDEAGLSIRIVRRLASVNGNRVDALMNCVNSEPFAIDHCFFHLDVFSYHARIVSASLALRSEDGEKYWELPIVMELIKNGGYGWHDLVADRGCAAATDDGYPNGRGGNIGPNDPEYFLPGMPGGRELVDFDETPISDPVLFDGDGQPLNLRVTTTPVWLEFQKYPEIDFKQEPYLAFGFIS